MKLSEYAQYDAMGLAELVHKGEVSPKELAQTAKKAIAKVNPDINAVIETYDDRIDELDPNQLGDGPLHGVPFLIKDMGDPEGGRICERGSRLLKGFVPQGDSFLIEMLRDSGVNNLGRTNVPEFCIAATTENRLYGNTSTPWRQGYSAGGSSGGAAAAVASGMVPIAHGSDVAGSIRVPASHCGCVGLKPSRGRVSNGPKMPESAWGMAQNLVQSRSVRDTALMLDCLSKPQVGDPFVVQQPSLPYLEHTRSGSRPLRIAYWNSALCADAGVHPEVAEAVIQVAKQLESMGHIVEEAAPKYDFDAVVDHFAAAWFVGYDKYFEAIAKSVGKPLDKTTLEPMSLAVYQSAKKSDPYSLFSAMDYFNGVRREFGAFLNQYDIWLTPTSAQPSEPWGQYHQGLTGMTGLEYLRHTELPIQFCMIYNFTGFPAISLPLAMTRDGLPIGIQLGAPHAQEGRLLQLAADLEQAMPWAGRIPSIHVSR